MSATGRARRAPSTSFGSTTIRGGKDRSWRIQAFSPASASNAHLQADALRSGAALVLEELHARGVLCDVACRATRATLSAAADAALACLSTLVVATGRVRRAARRARERDEPWTMLTSSSYAEARR